MKNVTIYIDHDDNDKELRQCQARTNPFGVRRSCSAPQKLKTVIDQPLFISSITVAELQFGVYTRLYPYTSGLMEYSLRIGSYFRA